jgi:hypothetical protein
MTEIRNRHLQDTSFLFHAGYLLGLFFYTEFRGYVFLRNVDRLSMDANFSVLTSYHEIRYVTKLGKFTLQEKNN